MPYYTSLATTTTHRPERPLHRLGRWFIYLGLVLAGGTGYACGVSCTRAQPSPEPSGALVTAPPLVGLLLQAHA
ncbi:MAG: hypothetical protein ACRYFK_05950 [Janthinobacterium lividum]